MQPPRWVEPMLAKPGPIPDDGARWSFEPKYDGWRAQVRVAGGRLEVRSRRGRPMTRLVPELGGMVEAVACDVVLDGELIVCGPDGRPDWHRLGARMAVDSTAAIERASRQRPVAFVAFDVLWCAGEDLTGLPYGDRRAALVDLGLDGRCWQTTPVCDSATDMALVTRQLGLEGIVAKKLTSRYLPGKRSAAWTKHVHYRRTVANFAR